MDPCALVSLVVISFGVIFIVGSMFYGANNNKIQELEETVSDLKHSIELIKNEIETHSRNTTDLHQQHERNFIGLKGSVEEMKQTNDGHMDSHDNHDQEIVDRIERLNQTVQELQEKVSKKILETQPLNNLSNEIGHLKQEIASIRHENPIIFYGILCFGLVLIVLFGYNKYKKDSKEQFSSVKYTAGQEKLNVLVDAKC